MFLADLIIIILASALAVWARISCRKEKNRLEKGDLKAEDFEIIE